MKLLDLFEAPIEDMNFVGDWSKNSSFDTRDRKLLNNPKAQDKIVHKWEKTVVPFNIYFVNSAEARKHTEVGQVSREWLDTNLPNASGQINIRSDAINVIFTNNKGAERVPMTAWVLAHRFGHAVSRYDWSGRGGSQRQIYDFSEVRDIIFGSIGRILSDAYNIGNASTTEREHMNKRGTQSDIMFKNFYQEIGTMRSAREKNIRNEFEFTLELLAQYMTTGKIKFNPLPQRFRVYKNSYAHLTRNEHDIEFYNSQLEELADTLKDYMESLLYACVGKTFVM